MVRRRSSRSTLVPVFTALCAACAASCTAADHAGGSGGSSHGGGPQGGTALVSPADAGAAGAQVAAPTGGGGAAGSSTQPQAGSGGAAGTNGSGGVAGAAGAAGAGGATWKSSFPTFTKHAIVNFSAGYMTFVADIDRDGKPDVVALSTGSDGLVWFKNPSWKKYTITTSPKQLIFAAANDIDGDGDLDVVIASDFDVNDTTGGGTISWAEAPADPTQNEAWTVRKIDAIPSSHRMRWGDIDGDGKKELLVMPIFGVGSSAPAHAGAVHFTAYVVPANPTDAAATWPAQVLDSTHLEVSHDLEVVDWDGDKAADILTASNGGIYLFRPALNKGAELLATGASGAAPDKGSSEVGSAISAGIASWPPSTRGTEPTRPYTRRARPLKGRGRGRCSART